jgi:hypothetical protein
MMAMGSMRSNLFVSLLVVTPKADSMSSSLFFISCGKGGGFDSTSFSISSTGRPLLTSTWVHRFFPLQRFFQINLFVRPTSGVGGAVQQRVMLISVRVTAKIIYNPRVFLAFSSRVSYPKLGKVTSFING